MTSTLIICLAEGAPDFLYKYRMTEPFVRSSWKLSEDSNSFLKIIKKKECCFILIMIKCLLGLLRELSIVLLPLTPLSQKVINNLLVQREKSNPSNNSSA